MSDPAPAAEQGEDARLIRDSAAAIATADLRRIRALRFQGPGFDRATWRAMCELGWLGLLIPEQGGGSGLGMREYCALVEELGAALVPEPLIPCAMAASLLQGSALAEVLAGERVVIPAWQEQPNTLAVGSATSVAGGRANGRKTFVPMAAGADAFLVAGRDGLALVERSAPGVDLAIERTQDGGNFGFLTFRDAPCTSIGGDIATALEQATLATSAYLLGVMERAFALTLDYLRTRQQFGRPIGSFQALQHRAADLKIQIALTRASVESAAASLDGGAHHCRAAGGGFARQVPRRRRQPAGHPGGDPAARRHRLYRRSRYRFVPAQGDGAVQSVRVGRGASRPLRGIGPRTG